MVPELCLWKKPYLMSSLILCLISCICLLNAPTTMADALRYRCPGNTNDLRSNFSANLKRLFSSFTFNSSTSNFGYATAGAEPDVAYGLYMCQGDLPNGDCQNCIQTAADGILQSCNSSRQAIIWYESCELRYSDDDFFGIVDADGFGMPNPDETTSSNKPYEVVSDLVRLVPLKKPFMFATNASDLYPVFALAQCSSDLSRETCSQCLTTILAAVKRCCIQAKGWRYLTPSCWIRYESTPLFNNPNGEYIEIIRSQCSESDFSSDSLGTEQANLHALLSGLKSNASLSGFYNTSAGDNSGKLYGLTLCRADLPVPGSSCSVCLDTATTAIAEECPNKTQGIMWYDDCFLKYSNQNIFGVVDENGQAFCSGELVSPASDLLTVEKASSLARAATENPKLFATGKVELSSTDSSYLLLQCTRDLSRKSCKSCLDRGISQVSTKCKQRKGWQYLSGSCTVRYEVFSFFLATGTDVPSPSASIPPLAPSNGDGNSSKESSQHISSKVKTIAIVVPIGGAVVLGFLLYCVCKLWAGKKGSKREKVDNPRFAPDRDLTFIDLHTIQVATNNFSAENKLGEGGFGPVYKGVLPNGKEIAVKRLSQKSDQGSLEFTNEVKLIAKVQHRNLVRMLGCCAEGEEKLLIYEFLPNKSLDSFLFDANKRVQLNWERRFLLITGIAKGLVYLHEDSHLKVIHRDLKASNVLLDNQMNPKISDFGMAKIYVPDESNIKTNRIVGTYGYMAPEYAMDGVFSEKSDVYSYGVLVLELVSGEKNGRAHMEQHGRSLLKHAWDLWTKDKASEFIDSVLLLENGTSSIAEAMKCINIGLLCVQEEPNDRPTMSSVVLMLRSDAMLLPQPKEPPSFQRKPSPADLSVAASETDPADAASINEVTTSIIIAR